MDTADAAGKSIVRNRKTAAEMADLWKGQSMNVKKITTEEFFYFAFFIILSVTKGLGLYEGQKLFTLLVVPALFCGLVKILISSYTRRQWAVQILLLLLTAIVYYESREIGILFVMFTILGMKHISLEKVFRLGLWIWSLCAIVLCTVYFTQIEHTVYRVSQKMWLGYIFRWSFGFTHPNTFHITYFALCAFILYELAERYRFRHFLLLMIGNALVFFYSVSYTGFGIVTLLLCGGLYVRMRPKFNWLEKCAVQLVLPAILLCSFVLPFLFAHSQSEIVQKLNLLVNTRIKTASLFLEPECISFFGVKMSYLAEKKYYLSIDSSYVFAFIHYGVIPFMLLMAAYLALVADYCRKQKIRELIMILCFLGAGLTEPLLFNTSFKNITLLFLGELLYRQKEGEEEYGLLTLAGRAGSMQKAGTLFEKLLLWITKQTDLAEQILRMMEDIWRRRRRQILVAIAGGALLGMVICALAYTEPKGYVIPRRYADWQDKNSVYLEREDDSDYDGYRIMNYQDADTPMQVVEGKAVRLESARYYVGSVLLGGLIGYLLGAGTMLLMDKDSYVETRRESNQEE
ncbi:MAG: hypothetical protein NC407_08590 [Lachnoclostridium sp.]|nr:hypothetical protein [Lachnoclostridium sp.]